MWAFRGSALRLHSSGRAPHSRRNGLRPPLQSLPRTNLQLPRHPPQKKCNPTTIRSLSPALGNKPVTIPKQTCRQRTPKHPSLSLPCSDSAIFVRRKLPS